MRIHGVLTALAVFSVTVAYVQPLETLVRLVETGKGELRNAPETGAPSGFPLVTTVPWILQSESPKIGPTPFRNLPRMERTAATPPPYTTSRGFGDLFLVLDATPDLVSPG